MKSIHIFHVLRPTQHVTSRLVPKDLLIVMNDYHLAQLNITKLKAGLEDPIMKEFRDFLAPVNQLAEDSPGFVWRFADDGGAAAIDVETPFEDAMIFVNMSMWEDFESLRAYTYDTVHSYFLKSRKKWSKKMVAPQLVLWWVKKGTIPTLEEAKIKLDFLARNGASAEAFSLHERYTSGGTKVI